MRPQKGCGYSTFDSVAAFRSPLFLHDMKIPNKKTPLAGWIVFVGVVAGAGCTGNEEGNRVSAYKASFALPVAALARDVQDDGGGMKACVRINEERQKGNVPCREMTIVDGMAKLTIDGLEKNRKYMVKVEFYSHSKTYGKVVLATMEKEITMVAGVNRLSTSRDAYSYPDEDQDGWSNLSELERGTDPVLVDKLLRSSPISPGNMGCSHGGVRVEFGIDTNADDVLDASEVKGSEILCKRSSDPLFQIKIDSAYPGPNCPQGGLLVRDGTDANANDDLEQGEISRVWFVCDGDLGWQGAAPVGVSNTGDAKEAQVALGKDGSAVAVWQQRDDAHYHIWARHYRTVGGWDTAVRIDNNESGDAVSPQVAMDDSGNVLVVWQQSDGVQESIWSSRYTPAKGWGDSEVVENYDSGPAVEPRLAMNEAGQAVVIWRQNAGEDEHIWANRFTPGSGWGTAAFVNIDTGSDGWSPAVAMDRNGNVIAVWVGWYNGSLKPWANRFSPESGWEGAERIGLDLLEQSDYPKIAMSEGGEALVVWEQGDEKKNSLWTNRFVPGVGWSGATPIEMQQAGKVSNLQVAMDGSGNAMLFWQQSDGLKERVWTSYFVPEGGWGEARLMEPDRERITVGARVAMGRDGRATAVWIRGGERWEIWANRFAPNEGWGVAESISIDDPGNAWHPYLALGEDGTAMTVWHHVGDERGGVWSNRFRAR